MGTNLKNPQTFRLTHPYFGAGAIEVELNSDDVGVGFLLLKVTAPDGRVGVAQIQPQDNGNLVVRVHLAPENPIHVLILQGSGVILEA